MSGYGDWTPTLVETTEGLAVTPAWMADVLNRVFGNVIPVEQSDPTPPHGIERPILTDGAS